MEVDGGGRWGRKPLWPYLLGSGVAPTTAKHGDLKKDFMAAWDIAGLVCLFVRCEWRGGGK